MIDPKNKLVFIHIPKCAGSSIENMVMGRRKSFKVSNKKKDIGTTYIKTDGFLDFAEGKHKPLSYYEENFKEVFESYYIFTFVRNPWSRLHSLYNYMRRVGSNKYFHSNSFNKWVSVVCDKTKNKENVTHLTGFSPSQVYFLKNKQNNLDSLDFIGKFENFKQDFSVIDEKFNFTKKNALLNIAPEPQDYTNVYNSESKKKVAQAFQEDIDCFGYKF